MNKDKQITVIATAIGYEWQLNPDGQWYLYGPPGTETVNRQLYHLDVHNKSMRVTLASLHASLPNIEALKQERMAGLAPNFPQDLNATYEVECWLYGTGIRAETYAVKLMLVVKPRVLEGSHRRSTAERHFELINATAAQRAEAFLRTIGKWEDDQ